MKAWSKCVALGCAVGLLLGAAPALAAEADTAALLKEIQALRQEVNRLKGLEDRVAELEKQLKEARAGGQPAGEAVAAEAMPLPPKAKLSQRLEATPEAAAEQGLLSGLAKRVSVYGAVELEAKYERNDRKAGDSTNSDVTLSTAEVFVDASINRYTRGVLHFLWEEDDTEPVDLDEAFIVVGQTEEMPWYFLGGRVYPAVALFETSLVSDPITQNVFETQETAAEAGYAGQWLNVSVGAFNGYVQEAGDGADDTVNSYFARVQVVAPEEALGGLSLTAGAAYVNNIADANTLRDEIDGQRVKSLVGGWSVMASASYGMASLTGEYITAADDFARGELGFAPAGESPRPTAYNVELALTPVDDWTLAARYEGSEDLFGLEPERQWGLAVAWTFLPDTTFSLEYLRGDYPNDDTRDLVTGQLAVEF